MEMRLRLTTGRKRPVDNLTAP